MHKKERRYKMSNTKNFPEYLPNIWDSIYCAHTVEEAVRNDIENLKICYNKYNDKRIMVLIQAMKSYYDITSNDFKQNRSIFNRIHNNTVANNEHLFIKTTARVKSLLSFRNKAINKLIKGESDPIRDTYAFRTTIDSKNMTEKELIRKCYEIMEETINFMITLGYIPCIAENPKDSNGFNKEKYPEIIIPEKSFFKTDTKPLVKDYIINPKTDGGYQSLHCVFVDAKGRFVEYQVRTLRMDHNAEYGPASHKGYKERQNSKKTGTPICRERVNIPGYCWMYNHLTDNSGLEKSFTLLLREHRIHS